MGVVERGAYCGSRVAVPPSMVAVVERGGPEVNHVQQASLDAIWALVHAGRSGCPLNIAIPTMLEVVSSIFRATRPSSRSPL
jgi:hypothetical protein